jgi:hypothetical protein
MLSGQRCEFQPSWERLFGPCSAERTMRALRRGLSLRPPFGVGPRRGLHGSPDLPADWVSAATKELKQAPRIANRHGVEVKPLYTPKDVEGVVDPGCGMLFGCLRLLLVRGLLLARSWRRTHGPCL